MAETSYRPEESEQGLEQFEDLPERPEGPVAAALLAGGIGALTMGLVTTLVEASVGVHDALEWNAGVGPLSGKTITAVAVWLLAWGILHLVLRDRRMNLTPIVTITFVLIALGVLGTFPIFFQAFASE